MPELPDVEGFRRFMARHVTGRPVRSAEVLDAQQLRNASAPALVRALEGRRFREPRRHGKWLIAETGGPAVLIHFGMTGRFDWGEPGSSRHRHDRVVFGFADGELRYRNMRKLGGVWLARDARERDAITGPLGPDAYELPRDELLVRLDGRRGGVKAALMDQRVVAGLGNLLVDEILWRARIHPRRTVTDLEQAELGAIHRQARRVLEVSDRHERVPGLPSWLTGARDRRAPCPRCGSALSRGTVAGRTTVWCPRCQPG